MIILINEIEENGPTDIVIKFESKLGGGLGIWRSKTAPKRLYSYDVELAVDDLVWQEDVFVSENRATFIQPEGSGHMKIQGNIEDVEVDGNLCYMRLGSSLFIFSCRGIPSNFRGYVTILTKTIEIFDTGSIKH